MAENGTGKGAGSRSLRDQQKLRTRKDLLDAAARLMGEGRKPASLEEVAEAALVSRATAYRYFGSIDQLLLEAEIDVAMPDTGVVLAGLPEDDPAMRLERVDNALASMMAANERTLRIMMVQSLERSLSEDARELPKRQNRRIPLIDAALGEKPQLPREKRDRLAAALALVMGPEAMVVFADVLQMDEEQARGVRAWAIRALLKEALEGG